MSDNDLGLKVMRRVAGISPELAGYLMAYEHVDPDADGWWVEGDRPRDAVWTDEIIANTVEYALVSASGKQLAKYDTLLDVEEALGSAEIDFTTKVKVGRKVVPVETLTV